MSVYIKKGTVIVCTENNHRIAKVLKSIQRSDTMRPNVFEWYIKPVPKDGDTIKQILCDPPCQGVWVRRNPEHRNLVQIHTAKGWTPK
jgi:16S rRNA C967 or C1407 C5-methylase (RsmB/RsmF family)